MLCAVSALLVSRAVVVHLAPPVATAVTLTVPGPAPEPVKAAGRDSPLINLRRLRDGALEVPEDFALAGW